MRWPSVSLTLFLVWTSACTTTSSARLVTVSYQYYNASAPAPVEGWNLAYIFVTAELAADGRLIDSSRSSLERSECRRVPRAQLRAVRRALESPQFMSAFAALAAPITETHPAPPEDCVTIVIGDRRVTFSRGAIPESVRPLLSAVDAAWMSACHSPLPSFSSHPHSKGGA